MLDDLRLRYLAAMEESMVDTATILAVLMRVTAHLDWNEVFADTKKKKKESVPPVSPGATDAPTA